MYRIEDITKINENINKIQDEASMHYKTYYEPTLKESGEVYKAIKNFLIRKKRVTYGGFAQNMLIMYKNPEASFYKEVNGAFFNWPDIADIEFYSPTPLQDIIELTEELYSQGFKNIQGKDGLHPETYKVFINFINYCDISYIPQHIHNSMPVIEINGIKCAHPHFMMVDAYRVLTDPMTSYWRLEKTLKRWQLILKYYPLDQKLKNEKFKLENNDESLKYIKKKIIHKSKLVVVGFAAYNYYTSKVSKEDIIQEYSFYELISENLHHDAKHIYKVLKNKYKDKITVKEYQPFFQFTDNKVEYFNNNKLILRLFGNNHRCTVYNYSTKKHTHYGTYNLVFMYLFFDYFYAFINRDKINTNLYNALIAKFHNNRNKYMDSHNITVLDKSPFQDFTFKCYGVPVDMARQARLEMKNRDKFRFTYIPSGKPKQAPEYNFFNTSGNPIMNTKNLIIKNN